MVFWKFSSGEVIVIAHAGPPTVVVVLLVLFHFLLSMPGFRQTQA